MDYPIHINGFEGHQLSLTAQGFLSGPRLLIDGQPAPKGRKAGQFVLRKNDGAETMAQVRSVMLGLDPAPQLLIDGQRILVAEPLKWYQWVWSAIPVLLIFIGGGLGALCGTIALAINARIFRSHHGIIAKYLTTAIITVASAAIFFVLAVIANSVIILVFGKK